MVFAVCFFCIHILGCYCVLSLYIDIPEDYYNVIYPQNVMASDPSEIKNLLYPKQSNGRRKPANPGPSKDLKLFRSVMSIVMQFKVSHN